MTYFKICLPIVTLLLLILKGNAQSSEIVLENQIGGQQVGLEFLASPTSVLNQNMKIGFDTEEDGGWLKMMSNHDLSFWSDNKKHITIKNSGFVGFGQNNPMDKVHVSSGDVSLELESLTGIVKTGEFSLYRNQNAVGALAFSQFLSGTLQTGFNIVSTTSLNCTGNCLTRLSTNGFSRLSVYSNGRINIPVLAGSGESRVYADPDGKLVRLSERANEVSMMIPASQWVAKFGARRVNESSYTELIAFDRPGVWSDVSSQIVILGEGLYCTPIFPSTNVLITELELRYVDNDPNRDMTLLIGEGEDLVEVSTSGSSDKVRRVKVDLNIKIDQENFELLKIELVHATSETRMLVDAVIKYEKVKI